MTTEQLDWLLHVPVQIVKILWGVFLLLAIGAVLIVYALCSNASDREQDALGIWLRDRVKAALEGPGK